MTTRIDKVAVLGTGVLGSQIAYQTAYSGFDVTAYDISDEILEKARNGFAGLAARYEQEVEGASDGSARAALARITYSSRLDDAVRGADLVIESAPERLDIKLELYTKLGAAGAEEGHLRHQQLDAAAQRPGGRDGPARPVPGAALRQRDLDPQHR